VNLANAPRHNKQLTATLAHSKPTRHNILTTKPNQIGHYLQVSTTTTRINYRNFGLVATKGDSHRLAEALAGKGVTPLT
jgi:hypothetical protein